MRPDFRLAIPAVVAWAATAIVVGVDSVVPALIAWGCTGALTALALVRRGLAIVALAAAAAALCCTVVAVQGPSRHPEVLGGAATSGRFVHAVATVTGRPGDRSFAATLDSVDGTVVHVPVRVFGQSPAGGIGTSLDLAGQVVATDPGDPTAYLLFTDRVPTVRAAPPAALEWANRLRASFLSATQRLPGDGGDLLAGLAIGDTTSVGDDLDRAMKRSSLSHLTAVSGANCAIVIGLFLAAGAALGVPRWARIAASLAVLGAFVILVTPEPSVLRAAVMAALVLAALAGGRPVRGIPVLALASLSLLIADPWLARSYGFALSVLATAGLLLLAAPLARVLGRWIPAWLALVVAVPAAAQLACQPVIIMLNAALPTYGVVANLLAGPAAPVATIVGLAACVLLVVAPGLGTLACQLAWLPSAWIAAVAQFFSALPGAQLPWLPDLPGVVLLAGLSAAVVLAALGRRWAMVVLSIAAACYVGIVGGGRLTDQLSRPADWQIAACDVGQGDAVFVRSAGHLALIDVGPRPERLDECMTQLGVGRIDLLVLTHYDLDHVGGAAAVLGRVDTVLVGPSGDPEDDRLREQFAAAGARVHQVSRGPSGLLGELRWQVLWPPKRLVGFEPGNPASVTVEFSGVGDCVAGCLSSIFLGDLGRDAQNRLIAAGPVDAVDVVKVAHHGSADQSGRLYERLRAVVGVIGVGADNGYGHPTDELLAILASVGTVPARTDTGGLILLAPGPEPGTVRVWTGR